MSKSLKNLFGANTGLDERSLESLTAALERSNLPGFDYLEFKQSVDALAQMGIDEATAFKSAFTTASTMGLTKEKLKDTAKHYREVLVKESEQFNTACQNQIEQKVNAKRTEVEKLKKQIEEYRLKIRTLEEQIVKAQETINNADQNIQSAMDKIQATKQSFDETFQSVVNQMDRDLENIERMI